MNDFTIRDLENLSGIKAHTIRMWEQRYNFLKPRRTDTNIRYYSNEELKTLLNISLLNKYGYKLCHIDQMQPDEICKTILLLQNEEAVQDRVVNDLVKGMVDLDIDLFESTLTNYVNQYGLENSVQEIIFPFLEKIGILWLTGHIMPAQEHFVSNIIRQKIIVAIEAVVPEKKIDKTVLLFLPEGEHHELGLLFLHFLLKKAGARVVYLGANVPLSDIKSIVCSIRPQIAFIHLTSGCPNYNFEKLIQSIPSCLDNLHTVISGNLTQRCEKLLPSTISFVKSFQDMKEFINKM